MSRRSVIVGAAALPLAARASERSGRVEVPAALSMVRDYVVEKVERGIVPSLVVDVRSGGRVLWAEAFGFADLEARRPATLASIYKIASVSKPFTVSALMTLADRGLVDFDAPANRYLRGAPLRAYRGSADEITLRRLAHHGAGLPIHEMLFYDGAPRLPPGETMRRYGFAAWRPGTRFVYSNLGTAILGFAAAEVSGRPWRRFLRESLLEPMDLGGTFAELTPGREREEAGRRADDLTVQYDYDVAGRFVRTGAHLTSHPGASAMWSEAADLSRFAEMHLGGGSLAGRRILSARAAAIMREPAMPSGEPGVVYGHGWIERGDLVRPNLCHSGGGPGMSAMLAAWPGEDATCVVLSNCFGAIAPEVTRRIAEALFGPATLPPAPSPPAAPGPAPLGLWRGTLRHHRGDIPIVLRVTGAGAAEIGFGRMPPAAMEAVNATAASLTGTSRGTLHREPGFHGESVIDLQLERDGGRLVGIADTWAKGYFEVAHRVELEPSR